MRRKEACKLQHGQEEAVLRSEAHAEAEVGLQACSEREAEHCVVDREQCRGRHDCGQTLRRVCRGMHGAATGRQ